MKRLYPTIWCWMMACTLYSQSSQTLQSGVNIGEESPAFMPQHAWGPDKGSHACPMCKYGYNPGVLYFVNTDLGDEDVSTFLRRLEQESSQRRDRKFKAFLIYTNPAGHSEKELKRTLSALGESLKIKHVALTYVESVDDIPSEMNLNKINPKCANTVIVYNKRTVTAKFVNFQVTDDTLEKLFHEVDEASKLTQEKLKSDK